MRRRPSPWQASQRPPFTLKLKRPGPVAALARFGQHGEQLADGSEDAGVGGRIRTRRAADGRLIDLDDLVDLLGAFDFAERAGALHRAVQLLRQRAVENVVHQRGFSRAGNAGDDGEQAERQLEIEIFQIVGFAAEHANRPCRWASGACAGTAIVRSPLR